MKVHIEGCEIEYKNEAREIDRIMEDIYKKLNEEDKFLKNLNIDGEKVFIDFGEYIFKRIDSIKEIHVEALTRLELIHDTLLTSLNYIQNAQGILKNIDGDINYNQMSDLMEGLNWLIETFTYMDKDSNLKNEIDRKEEWNLYAVEVYKLVELFPIMLKALGDKDDFKLLESIRSLELIFKDMEDRIVDLIRLD